MSDLQTAIDEAKDRLRTGKPTLAMHMELVLNCLASLQQRVEALEAVIVAQQEYHAADFELWCGDAGENGEDKTQFSKASARLRSARKAVATLAAAQDQEQGA